MWDLKTIILILLLILFLVQKWLQHTYKESDRLLLSLSLDLDGNGTKPKAHLENIKVNEKDYIRTLFVGKMDQPNNIVFCHGFMSGLAVFFKTYPDLFRNGYNIIAFDWLGMGLSSRPKFPSIHDSEAAENFFIESLEQWRLKLKIERMTVVAHSLGGYLISLYALKYPQHIEKLILVSPAGFGIKPSHKQVRPPSMLGKLFRELFARNITPPRMIRSLGYFGHAAIQAFAKARFPHLNATEFALIKQYFFGMFIQPGSSEAAFPALLNARMDGFIAKNPLPERIKHLEKEIVFVFGTNDWMDHEHVVLCKNLLYSASLYTIKDTTHHLYLDNHKVFNEWLLAILRNEDYEHESVEKFE